MGSLAEMVRELKSRRREVEGELKRLDRAISALEESNGSRKKKGGYTLQTYEEPPAQMILKALRVKGIKGDFVASIDQVAEYVRDLYSVVLPYATVSSGLSRLKKGGLATNISQGAWQLTPKGVKEDLK